VQGLPRPSLDPLSTAGHPNNIVNFQAELAL